jgi:hypothetical protein
MGSGYNDSVSASNVARGKASIRQPIHFWLDVPYYEYELPCSTGTHVHTYQSRTPIMPRVLGDAANTDAPDMEDFNVVWCERCQDFTVIDDAYPEPLNRSKEADEYIAFLQDKGLLRERVALELQSRGLLDTEAEIAEAAVEFGVPVGEIKKINAGLTAIDNQSGLPLLCKAGLHEMTFDNTKVDSKGKRCLACYRKADAEAKARRREKRKSGR